MINELGTQDEIPPARLIQAMSIDRMLFGQEWHIRKQEIEWVREAMTYCIRSEGENAKETCNPLVRQYLKMLRTHESFGFHDLERLKYKIPPPGTPDMRSERIQKNKYLAQEYNDQMAKMATMSHEERQRQERYEFEAPGEGQAMYESMKERREREARRDRGEI